MAKSYGDDLRRKLLQAHDRGEGTLEQLAQRFSVSARWTPQSHRRSGAAIARVGAGPARSDLGGVTAETGEGSATACQHRTAVAGAAADGSAAKKKSLHASERDTEANQQRRQAFQQTIGGRLGAAAD